MEIFKNFGVNPINLVAQIVNFLIILFLLKKFLYQPILSTLKKREDEIKNGLKSAEEGQKTLENALQREKEILHKAQIQAEKIITNAREESEELKKQIEETTRKDTQRLIEQAKETIKQEAKETEQRLIKRIGEIAVAILEKSLGGIFGEKEQKIILKKAISELGKQNII